MIVKNIPRSAGLKDKITSLLTSNFTEIKILSIILIPKFDQKAAIDKEIEAKIQEWKQLLKNKDRPK